MKKYIILMLLIWFIFLISQINYDNGYALWIDDDIVFEHIMYTSMENTCNSHFIGEDWEESMQYEDMCRDMWTEWTQLIINQ